MGDFTFVGRCTVSYEQHIKALEQQLSGRPTGPEERSALEAAIDLMRAAAPKNAEEEREHCRQLAFEALKAQLQNGGAMPSHFAAARAAVWAKCAAEIADWKRRFDLLSDQDDIICAENRKYEAEIERLRAENAQLEGEYARLENSHARLQSEHQALRAENVSIDGAVASAQEAADVCLENYNKLQSEHAALRTAAERYHGAVLANDPETADSETQEEYEAASAALRAALDGGKAAPAIEEQLAAARAEGVAAVRERDEWKRTQQLAEKYGEALETKLAAAQAEIERLRAENKSLIDQEVGQAMDCARHEREARADERAKLQGEIETLKRERDQMAFERDTHMESAQNTAATFHTNGVQSLQRQIAEQKAEIENMRAQELETEEHRNEALTKLTNLRAAAERYRNERTYMALAQLDAAIEASK